VGIASLDAPAEAAPAAGGSAAEPACPRKASGTAAEANRDDFTKPRREMLRAMSSFVTVPGLVVKAREQVELKD